MPQSKHRVECGIQSTSAAHTVTPLLQALSSMRRMVSPTARSTISSSLVGPVASVTMYARSGNQFHPFPPHSHQLCAMGGQPVIKDGVEALGKVWHRAHFLCQNCEELLDPKGKICAWEGYRPSFPDIRSRRRRREDIRNVSSRVLIFWCSGNHFVRDVTSGCPARFGRRLKSSRISKPKWNGRPKRNKCVRPVVLSLRPGRLPSLQPKNSMVPKEKYQLGLVLWLAVSCGQRCLVCGAMSALVWDGQRKIKISYQVQTKKLFHGHDRITLPPPRNCELHGDVPISQSSWVVQEDQSQRK